MNRPIWYKDKDMILNQLSLSSGIPFAVLNKLDKLGILDHVKIINSLMRKEYNRNKMREYRNK